jgi:hypothetical protein
LAHVFGDTPVESSHLHTTSAPDFGEAIKFNVNSEACSVKRRHDGERPFLVVISPVLM